MAFEEDENLVTPVSLAMSLAPPRAPPHDSAQRYLLLGLPVPSRALLSLLRNHEKDGILPQKKRHAENENAHHENAHNDDSYIMTRERMGKLLQAAHQRLPKYAVPHPHLPVGPEVGDRTTRALGAILPLSWQNHFRDSGSFRSLVDALVTVSIPTVAMTQPSAIPKFLRLSQNGKRFKYGSHPMQVMDLFASSPTTDSDRPFRGLLFFVVRFDSIRFDSALCLVIH
eukprot:scaffold188674_cov45-Attheya_sp.AAC.2